MCCALHNKNVCAIKNKSIEMHGSATVKAYDVLVFCVQEFRRDGNDLHIGHKIGLVEALCGFQFMLTHLDGRHLVIKYPPGKVIEPGEHVLCVYRIYLRSCIAGFLKVLEF